MNGVEIATLKEGFAYGRFEAIVGGYGFEAIVGGWCAVRTLLNGKSSFGILVPPWAPTTESKIIFWSFGRRLVRGALIKNGEQQQSNYRFFTTSCL